MPDRRPRFIAFVVTSRYLSRTVSTIHRDPTPAMNSASRPDGHRDFGNQKETLRRSGREAGEQEEKREGPEKHARKAGSIRSHHVLSATTIKCEVGVARSQCEVDFQSAMTLRRQKEDCTTVSRCRRRNELRRRPFKKGARRNWWRLGRLKTYLTLRSVTASRRAGVERTQQRRRHPDTMFPIATQARRTSLSGVVSVPLVNRTCASFVAGSRTVKLLQEKGAWKEICSARRSMRVSSFAAQ